MIDDSPAENWSIWHSSPPARNMCFIDQIGQCPTWYGELWRQNPQERMVVFATYLGSVEMLSAEIEKQYPGKGVTVLKGGEHRATTCR